MPQRMAAPDSTIRASDRAIRLAMAVLLAALALAGLWSIAHRGPWYDEFFTLYVTSRRESFTQALTRHWLADNHPPLYYALVDLTRWLGDQVEQRRMVNALIGALALAAGWALARTGSPRFRLLAAFYLAGLAAQPLLLLHLAELRSYFLSLAAVGLLVLALARFWLEPRDAGRGGRLALWSAALVALNTHIATTLIAGALLAAFTASALLRRRTHFLRAVLPPAVVSALVFLAVTAIQFPRWEANTRAFWIKPGLAAARWAIENVLVACLAANPVLLAGGAAGIALLLWRLLRREPSPEGDGILALGLGLAGAIVAVVAIHLVRPFVVDRYLVGLAPPISMALALGLAALAGKRPVWSAAALAATVLAALFALHANALRTAARPSWSGTASRIAQEVHRCPAAVVHHDPLWNAEVAALPPAENRQVLPFAYATMAARHHFALEPETSRRVATGCPTLFWTEHARAPTEPALLARLHATGFAVPRVTIVRVGDGWIGYAEP